MKKILRLPIILLASACIVAAGGFMHTEWQTLTNKFSELHNAHSELYNAHSDLQKAHQQLSSQVDSQKDPTINTIEETYRSVVAIQLIGPNGNPLGNGTGFFVDQGDESAYIMTNNHVTEKSLQVPIPGLVKINVIAAGSPFPYQAEIVGSDPISDISILKIKKLEGEQFQVVNWAEEGSYIEGTPVIAIGHGLGQWWTSTTGRVSFNQRTGVQLFTSMIQHDAVINQGNSGGPLFNNEGEVIGVNSMMLSPGASSARAANWSGVSFAIESWQAQRSLNQIMETGKAKYVDVDFRLEIGDFERMKDTPREDRNFLFITEVEEDGIAYNLGLRNGDNIQSLDGDRVRGHQAFMLHMIHKSPGDIIEIEVLRDGETIIISYELAEYQPE